MKSQLFYITKKRCKLKSLISNIIQYIEFKVYMLRIYFIVRKIAKNYYIADYNYIRFQIKFF